MTRQEHEGMAWRAGASHDYPPAGPRKGTEGWTTAGHGLSAESSTAIVSRPGLYSMLGGIAVDHIKMT